jgi:hypothetical protein
LQLSSALGRAGIHLPKNSRPPKGPAERLGQHIGCLQRFGGAQGEALLAVPAFLGRDLGDEADLLADAAVHESHRVFLFHLGAVAHAQAAVDAEGRMFFKAVAVRAVFLGQVLQLKSIRARGPAAVPGWSCGCGRSFRSGSSPRCPFPPDTRRRPPAGPAPVLQLHVQRRQPPKGSSFSWWQRVGDIPALSCRLQNGHPFPGADFLAVYLKTMSLIFSCSF